MFLNYKNFYLYNEICDYLSDKKSQEILPNKESIINIIFEKYKKEYYDNKNRNNNKYPTLDDVNKLFNIKYGLNVKKDEMIFYF